MNILFKTLLAAVSTIFCVALIYASVAIIKKRFRYHGPRTNDSIEDPRKKKLRQVQDEMFEECNKYKSE